jgi:hypothetical protein
MLTIGLGDLQFEKTCPDTTSGSPSFSESPDSFQLSVSLVSHSVGSYSRNCRC